MKKIIYLLFALYSVSVSIQAASGTEYRVANDGQVRLDNIPIVPDSLIEDLLRYQNIRTATFSDWSEDGSSLYIVTRFGDVTQLHHVTMPGGARYQLTFNKEPVREVTRQHHGHLLAYTMDTGGNENSQVYLFDPVTHTTSVITDGLSQNASVLWSPNDQFMVYTSTRRNGAANDIWMAAVDTASAPRILLEAPDGAGWSASAWSADGNSLLVRQFISVEDSRIYQLNVASGEYTPLRGDAGAPTMNKAIGYDADASGYFFISNQDGRYEQLWHSRLDGTDAKNITADISWDIDSVVLSADGGRGAFVVNENGVGRLYLLDTEALRYRRVDGIPSGLITDIAFSPDGRRLAMTLNTPRSPSDVYVLQLKSPALKHKELQRWTYSETGGLDAQKFSQPELIQYPSYDKRSIPAYVYKPQSTKPHPVVIVIHGGPEAQFRPVFENVVQLWLDKLGVAVIAPNVRGSTGYGREYVSLDNGMLREDAVKDIGALLDWIGKQPDLDASRVAVMGGSYGGYMSLACATHYSDRLKAAVDVVGISNFVTFLESTKEYRRDLRRVEYGDERDPAMRKFLNEISPARQIDRIHIPLLIVQGQNDPRVPVMESEQMVKALREQNREVWYMNALNEGHGYKRKANRDLYQQVVVMFLKKYLLGE